MIRTNLWNNGFRPVAIYDAALGDPLSGKRPHGNDWRARALQGPPGPVEPGRTNTGILTDGLRAIDVDIDNRAIASDVRMFVEATCGETIVRTRADSGRCLLVYRAAEGEPRKIVLKGTAGKVEFLGAGQQFVAFGKHYATLADLEWENGSPATRMRGTLPPMTEAQVDGLMAALASLIGADVPTAPAERAPVVASSQGATASLTDVGAALEVIPNEGAADWEAWNRVLMAIFRATEGSDGGLTFAHAWSAKHPDYDPTETDARWEHYRKSPPTKITAGTLFYLAEQARPGWIQPSRYADLTSGGSEFGTLAPEETPYVAPAPVAPEPSVNEATESAVALGFARDMRDTMLFDHSASAWFTWDGKAGLWRRDDTGRAFAAFAAYIVQVRALLGGTDKAMAGVSFVGNVAKFVQNDQRFAVNSALWDTDPWVLGVPGGYVNLRTGAFHPGDPGMRMTKQTSVSPAAIGTAAPLWESFLLQATLGDPEFVRYLQRFVGYCLTGQVTEEMFAFFYGEGGAGKGTFWGAILAILGAYGVQMSIETFSAKSKQNPEYARAKMVGARLVTASETEQVSGWAESAIKEFTGNEGLISAREIYGRIFNYRFQAKIAILGNHAPTLRGGSKAMKRRLHVVPFDNAPAVPDLTLKERLVAEYPAILRWAIEGCLAWQRDGLGTCEAVKRASAAYFEEQDSLAMWAAERLDIGAGHDEKRTDLLTDYMQWARANGETAPVAHAFYESVRRSLRLADVRGAGGVRLFRGASIRREGNGSTIPASEFSDIAAILH